MREFDDNIEANLYNLFKGQFEAHIGKADLKFIESVLTNNIERYWSLIYEFEDLVKQRKLRGANVSIRTLYELTNKKEFVPTPKPEPKVILPETIVVHVPTVEQLELVELKAPEPKKPEPKKSKPKRKRIRKGTIVKKGYDRYIHNGEFYKLLKEGVISSTEDYLKFKIKRKEENKQKSINIKRQKEINRLNKIESKPTFYILDYEMKELFKSKYNIDLVEWFKNEGYPNCRKSHISTYLNKSKPIYKKYFLIKVENKK